MLGLKVVLLQGVKGGVGTTTVTANLAAALCENGQQVFVLDTCKQNTLRMHFGADFNDCNGWVKQLAQGNSWRLGAYQSHIGINFFPFGVDIEHDLLTVALQFLHSSQGFLQIIQTLSKLDIDQAKSDSCQFPAAKINQKTVPVNGSISAPSTRWLLVDSAVELASLVEYADLEIQILNPDAASYLCFLQQNSQGFSRASKRRYLINAYSPSIALERDIHNLLLAQFNQVMVPAVVHQDQFIKEALAQKQTAFEGATHSEAHRDFRILATWARSVL